MRGIRPNGYPSPPRGGESGNAREQAGRSKVNLPTPLLDAIAEAGARVRVGYPWWLRPWLARDVIGLALGRRIYLRDEGSEEAICRLIRHELVHVRQAARLGLPLFLLRYVSEFSRNLWRYRSIHSAYSNLSFEIEARAAEEDQ